ncbi:MAG: aspartate carbamoyltransferase catalytic subunit [Candidatus Margulisiibacteriota bacterium]
MKHLIGLEDIDLKTIQLIFDQARTFKEIFQRPIKQVPTLRGKNVVSLFYESSTRTRASFDLAVKSLGASSVSMNVATSSVNKGETLIDTARNLEVMGIDAIIIRHPMSGAPNLLAQRLNIPVINAGDGWHEHPTQALLDIYTMNEACPDLSGKKVIIVGDIAHSRVARSNIWGLLKMGVKVTVVGPSIFIPKDIDKMGVSVSNNLDEVLPEADFINVLRIQLERKGSDVFPSQREYTSLFGITEERIKKAKKNVRIMHPGPINRGVEIDSAVADGPYNVILNQVNNGVAIRMAIIYMLLSRSTS